MDYSKFLDENFDVKEWVNGAFRSHKDAAVSKDQYATNLVMKLQMFIQEVNNVIEDSSQQALQNLPRVMREIEAVRQEAALLQDQMRLVKQDIQKVEQDTSQSMQTLLKLDGIKSRMKATSDALKEADNWTTLSADVEEVFLSQDIQAITAKLVGMQQSLQMLVDTPDYQQRCQHLEKLQNKLETLLSPQVVAAFNAQSLEATQTYAKIFEDINRLSQLYKYYHKCQKVQLINHWKSILDTNSDDTFLEWLTAFYDHLLSTWHGQIKWCSQVFRDPVPILCDLFTEVIKDLDPSLDDCLAVYIDEQGSNVTLISLINLKQVSERFSKSIESAVEHCMSDNPEHAVSLLDLQKSIYAVYQPYLSKYKHFEEVALQCELDNIRLDHEEIVDSIGLLGESVSKLMSSAKKANERCIQFTDGFGYLYLLEALKMFYISYCREFKRVLSNVRAKCYIGRQQEDFEDWSLFQQSLRMIQICGELIIQTEELDKTLINNIISTLGKYFLPSQHSPLKETTDKKTGKKVSLFQRHASLLLEDEADIEILEEFVLKLEEGDTPSVLSDVTKEMFKLSQEVHKFGFDIVFAQLKKHLVGMANMEVWTSLSAGTAITSDLPAFSLSPQEYITKVGQYLMTLPQLLEPYIIQDNQAVTVALQHGRLPYTEDQDIPEHSADLWLQSIARGTMFLYSEEILKIYELSPHGTKQLVTDLDYLCNVLDDLGLSAEQMHDIKQLLKAEPDEFRPLASRMPQRLANVISQMRNIEL
ncbi:conserved oligomeric Golgi complex subunit 7 isoform X1 [Octopus bimaculoides]|uniref:Conserved oligomeric Golgi complex subunit 7 n=2 Tax=Octopus bimaculoides TaxID=37653 RepID=A0A0L8FYI8_OCTBM|nr:conserved oligomeric Golgi complex subunit 7 isoform X1 [Octopus bimaculoides]|eukprot:XP_014785708.1 PREDICTED: conserved oligomeric Golgi complex subunit 7-like isoform X1 [Octopus bimaculoides]